MTVYGENLLGPKPATLTSVFSKFLEKQWRILQKNPEYKKYLDKFEDYINELDKKKSPEGPRKSYYFNSGFDSCKKTLRGLEIEVWKDENAVLLFDRLKRKIYLKKGYHSEEIASFSDIKHCTLRYRPCLIQNEKTRFAVNLSISGNIGIRLSTIESCYDDDRRSIRDQLADHIKTGKAIARTGGWYFQVSGSEIF